MLMTSNLIEGRERQSQHLLTNTPVMSETGISTITTFNTKSKTEMI